MTTPDLALFDPTLLNQTLNQAGVPIPAYKEALQRIRTIFDERFKAGVPIQDIVRGRAAATDQILQTLWQRFNWGDDIALLAVGGYGRGELHPHSDIDVLILMQDDQHERYREPLEAFITLLWDIGLVIGHSVRSIADGVAQARADLSVITSMMESRTLSGPDSLRTELQKAIAPEHLWSCADFFQAKRAEQRERHDKFNNTEYNLEPNVKSSPGGLRDIQTLYWVAHRLLRTNDHTAMVQHQIMTQAEYNALEAGKHFIWTVRYALHMLTGRAEDRLLFDHQLAVAAQLGYTDENPKAAIERFMKQYYRAVMEVAELSDLLMQHFEECILNPPSGNPATPINNRFQLRDGYLEAVDEFVFSRSPFAMLEIFVLMAQNPSFQGIRAETIRQLRAHRYLIDEAFRRDIRNTSLFVELFKCNEGIHRNLRRMNRYGLLGRYLPEFGHIVGQMQHDLFHIYTVDAHTLNVIKYLRKLTKPGVAEKYPLASELVEQLPKPELIYLAGLFHDIGKGRGGDHSELGAIDAQAFGERHNLPRWDTRLIVWLVENHLMMSMNAQRKDLSDPQVINDFAQLVGDKTHLDYLYVLTVADINATNPKLWNSWRASLLRQLYTQTLEALKRGLENPLNSAEKVQQTQDAALLRLEKRGADLAQAEMLWAQLGDDYFLRHNAHDVAWHTEEILKHGQLDEPLVLIRDVTTREFEGGTQIFIYAPDQHDFFAVTVAVMDQLNLNIHDARIMTSTSRFTLDTYIVLDVDGQPIGQDLERVEKINARLTQALRHPDGYSTLIQRRVPRQLKHFSFAPRITISNDAQGSQTIIELVAPDRPGLLARVGQLFKDFNLSLHNAKISTMGERVEDVFFVTDANQQPLSDPALCQRLQHALIEQLNQPAAAPAPNQPIIF